MKRSTRLTRNAMSVVLCLFFLCVVPPSNGFACKRGCPSFLLSSRRGSWTTARNGVEKIQATESTSWSHHPLYAGPLATSSSSLSPNAVLSAALPPRTDKEGMQRKQRADSLKKKHQKAVERDRKDGSDKMGNKGGHRDPRGDSWKGLSMPKHIPKLSDVLDERYDYSGFVNSTTSQRSSTGAGVSQPALGAGSGQSTPARLSNNPTNRKERKRAERQLPWKAGYYTSLKSQSRIKYAASSSRTKKTPLEQAVIILQTLFDIPPERCNPSNLVCALTMSAKALDRKGVTNETFRMLLHRALIVLQELLVAKVLSARQLCNTVWALAKFYDRDATLFPPPPPASSTDSACVTETWDLRQEEFTAAQRRNSLQARQDKVSDRCSLETIQCLYNETVNEIAVQLSDLVETDPWEAKEGELCMTAWAFGILHRRRRPVGWQHEPTTYKVPSSTTEVGKAGTEETFSNPTDQSGSNGKEAIFDPQDNDSLQFVTFQGWNSGDNSGDRVVGRHQGKGRSPSTEIMDDQLEDTDDQEDEEETPTSRLMDAIAVALCQSPSSSATTDVATNETSDGDTTQLVDGVNRLQFCNWSELANVIWAYAAYGRSSSMPAQKLIGAIANEATLRLNLCTVTTTTALNEKDGTTKSPAALRQCRPQESPQSRDIAQTMWSLGAHQVDNYELADHLVNFVDATSAFVALNKHQGHNATVNGSKAGREMNHRHLSTWSCADIVQVALALAHSRLDERQLLELLYQEALDRLERYSLEKDDLTSSNSNYRRKRFFAWEICILLWTQARLYLRESEGPMFSSFAIKAAETLNGITQSPSSVSLADMGVGPQEQANLAWSLTVLETYRDTYSAVSVLRAVFAEACDRCYREGLIHTEHAHQLWQSLFLLEDECPECVVDAVPAYFRAYLREQWLVEKARTKFSSARHRSLSRTLSLMGVAHENEHDEDIDVAIVLQANALWTHQTERQRGVSSSSSRGLKVAVEFDGPNHFTRITASRGRLDNTRAAATPDANDNDDDDGNDGGSNRPRALGHTVLKYRLLKKQGWSVVRVPYYEYDKIPFWASMERQRYLQRLLKTHGEIVFSERDFSEYKPLRLNRQSRYD